MARKSFSTTIDEELQKSFKNSCEERSDKMNDVLEAFMHSYVNGDFVVEKETKFILKKSK